MSKRTSSSRHAGKIWCRYGAFVPYFFGYGADVAHLRRIFLLFGLLVAEHSTKIDRTSNSVQLWRICAVFFQNRVQLWRVCAINFLLFGLFFSLTKLGSLVAVFIC